MAIQVDVRQAFDRVQHELQEAESNYARAESRLIAARRAYHIAAEAFSRQIEHGAAE